jgi:cytoskeletal protein CcmA (bactofilin family)
MKMKDRIFAIWIFIIIISLIPLGAGATTFISVKGEGFLADTVFNDDLFITGSKIKMQGRVDGDVFAFCQEIVLSDSVNGSFNSFSMNVQILGSVGQSVRGFANYINCNAPVGRNLLVFGNQVTVGPKARIGHNGDFFCAKLVFQGKLDGDLKIEAKDAEISGYVAGNVWFKDGQLEVGPDAVIDGNVYYKSVHKANISKSARISGEVNWEELEEKKGGGTDITLGRFFAWIFSVRGYLLTATVVSLLSLIFSAIPFPAGLAIIFYSIVFLISGNVVILLTRERTRITMAMMDDKFLPSLGLGFVIFFVVPVISIVVLCTFLGAPLGIALLFLFGIALLAGTVYATAFLGSKFWKIVGRKKDEGSPHLYYSTGIVLLIVLSFIPILGYLLVTAVIMTGLGGLAQTFKSAKF